MSAMRFYILPLGCIDLDKGRILTPGSGDGERLVVPVWASLLQVGGLNILFDTGMHPVHITDPRATFGDLGRGDLILPMMEEEDRIENRLGELGLAPDDIDIVVNTHLHFDHAGCNYLFTNSRILVQRDHYQQATGPSVRFQPEYWNLPDLSYELVEGDLKPAPGLQILEVPGHVNGLQVPVLRLPDSGTLVIAGDAISLEENLEQDNWAAAWDARKARASAKRLAVTAEDEGGRLIFGHDPEQWKTLKLSPAYYS